MKWMYLLYVMFVDTAFLLCAAEEMDLQKSKPKKKSVFVGNLHSGGEVAIIEEKTTPQVAVIGRFLRLYCKAVNFCQVEWLREGLPMEGFEHAWDFPSDVQENKMSLPPTDDYNQTLEFNELYCEAEGMWTCVVSGEVGQLNHTMEIVITGMYNTPGVPCRNSGRWGGERFCR